MSITVAIPMPKPVPERRTLGQVAYDAYVESAGGVSLVSGAKLPAFPILDARTQEAWQKAAAAAAWASLTLARP